MPFGCFKKEKRVKQKKNKKDVVNGGEQDDTTLDMPEKTVKHTEVAAAGVPEKTPRSARSGEEKVVVVTPVEVEKTPIDEGVSESSESARKQEEELAGERSSTGGASSSTTPKAGRSNAASPRSPRSATTPKSPRSAASPKSPKSPKSPRSDAKTPRSQATSPRSPKRKQSHHDDGNNSGAVDNKTSVAFVSDLRTEDDVPKATPPTTARNDEISADSSHTPSADVKGPTRSHRPSHTLPAPPLSQLKHTWSSDQQPKSARSSIIKSRTNSNSISFRGHTISISIQNFSQIRQATEDEVRSQRERIMERKLTLHADVDAALTSLRKAEEILKRQSAEVNLDDLNDLDLDKDEVAVTVFKEEDYNEDALGEKLLEAKLKAQLEQEVEEQRKHALALKDVSDGEMGLDDLDDLDAALDIGLSTDDSQDDDDDEVTTPEPHITEGDIKEHHTTVSSSPRGLTASPSYDDPSNTEETQTDLTNSAATTTPRIRTNNSELEPTELAQ